MTDDLGVPDIADRSRRIELHRPAVKGRTRSHLHPGDKPRTPIIGDHIRHRRRTRRRSRRHIIIGDRAHRRTISDRRPRRIRQTHRERLVTLHRSIPGDHHMHHLRGHPRRERHHPGSRRVVHPRGRGPVRRHIPHRHRLIRGRAQRHGEHHVGLPAVALDDGGIGDGQRGQRVTDVVGGAVVVEDRAEAAGGQVEARCGGRGLPETAGGVAGHRPHRQHPETLGAGEVLERLGVGDGEDLGGDVVDPDHRRHPDLIPAEGLTEFTVERCQLGVGGLGSLDRVGAHGLGVRAAGRRGGLAVVHRHHVDAVEFDARADRRADHVQAVGGQARGQDRQRVPHLEVRQILLHQGQRLTAQRDRGGVCDGGPLDVEVDTIQ